MTLDRMFFRILKYIEITTEMGLSKTNGTIAFEVAYEGMI